MPVKSALNIAAALVLSIASARNAAAAPLIQFNFTSSVTGASSTAENVSATAIAAIGITLTSETLTSPIVVNDSGAAAVMPILRVQNINSTSIDASSEWIQFTLTPDSGWKLDLQDVSFDLGAGGSSARYLRAQYSFDGVNFTTAGTGNNPAQTNRYSHFSFPLIDEDVANQETASPVTFRFKVAAGSSTELRVDNLTINGQVVPEPASLALIGLPALGLLRRRR